MTEYRRIAPAARAREDSPSRFTRFPPGGAAPDPETERPAAAPAVVPAAPARAARMHWMVLAMTLSAFLPNYFSIGGLALTPARVAMVVFFVPVLLMYVQGRAGQVLPQDVMLALYALWTGIAMFAYGGFARTEMIGITIIESLSPYLLARCLIRSKGDFLQLLKLLWWITLALMVLAAIESTTGIRLLSRLFGLAGPVYPPLPITYEKRLGLSRAMTVFQHPILFGVVISSLVGLFWTMPGKTGIRRRLTGALPAMGACFFSLSTGAWLGVIVQMMLLAWGRVLRGVRARWKILAGLVVLAYVTVEMLSNRTPFDVFISYLTLNSGTGYMRKLIFIYGMDNVWANPLFGIGLGDWVRPDWMYSASVDNFWLMTALRYGIPAFVLLAGAYLCLIATLIWARPRSEEVQWMRLGMVFVLVGLALSMSTVHIWGSALAFMLFLLGAMGWVATPEQDAPDEPAPAQAASGRQRAG